MKKIVSTLLCLVTIASTNPVQITDSFFGLYKENRQNEIPNYISLDFILTANYLFKQQSIVKIEETMLYPKFKRLASQLRENLLKNYNPSKKEALAYILVLNELLGNNNQNMPPEALELAKRELTLIQNHQAIANSPIAKVLLDYTQYKVRGKYTKNQQLSSYFLALKYMSYTPFMVNAHSFTGVSLSVAKQQMKNAIFISEALKPIIKEYTEIEHIIHNLSGEGDDLTLFTIINQSKEVVKIQQYLNGLKKFPKINERIIRASTTEKKEIPFASLALKFLPSRFTLDGYIFSQLTYPNVGKVIGKPNRLSTHVNGIIIRGYPTIYDISGVLVDLPSKESNYQGYTTQLESLRDQLPHQKIDNLYGYDFAIYSKLLKEKRINSFKGYYTQSRYILNLYQKQSYTAIPKGISFDNRKKAFLQENIGEILSLLIAEDKLLPHADKFIKILKRLKQLDKKKNHFNQDDVAYLNYLDKSFKSILTDIDTPISVDIHTNPIEKKVMYEVLKKPFIKDIKGFRGAIYNQVEEIKVREEI